MALNNRERIDRGFQDLAGGLRPYVDRVMNTNVPGGQKWTVWVAAQEAAAGRKVGKISADDPQVLLNAIINHQKFFMSDLSAVERNYATELRDYRKRHAHHEEFTASDVARTLDTMERLLTSVGAVEAANSVRQNREDHQRGSYEQKARKKAERNEVANVAGTGMKSWRDVVTPHEDVAAGQFNAAEFAADLHAVASGKGASEYGDPVAFFERTYLTNGLRDLITQACARISGDDNASPLVNLQTNFGGGKTHSMLALYHAFSGTPIASYPQEAQDLLAPYADSLGTAIPRVALVGHRNLQASGTKKPDGTFVNTIWGELAWQLGGPDAYAIVKDDDVSRTAPTTALTELLQTYTPCLILVDEWVAYARQLVGRDDLAAGSFETQFTFAQSLAQTAADTSGVLVVVSIPASDSPDQESPGVDEEVGGPNGREALKRLQNIIRRSANQWRPASSDESFEIVRRRLFKDPDAVAQNEITATAKQFLRYYQSETSKGHFPSSASAAEYEARIRKCYPIHPELFDRLYNDWSTLERFQRTRGVLRLMSNVVHTLWLNEDAGPLINVGSIPLDDDLVVSELTQYLEDAWKPIIDSDIDGANAMSRRLDAERPTFGQRATARRLARATFFGSAPTLKTAHKGMERNAIFLGVAVPGDTPSKFGDALALLQQHSSYLEADGSRYWYYTSRSIARTVNEHAESLRDDPGTVHLELVKRIKQAENDRAGFAGIHICPEGSADIPDEECARLVVLHPSFGYSKGNGSAALSFATAALSSRGSSQRTYRSMLVFLAPDEKLLPDLEDAVRKAMAWRHLEERSTEENLTAQQIAQAKRELSQADGTVLSRIRETYVWALAPSQIDGSNASLDWSPIKADGEGFLAERVTRKLENSGAYSQTYAARNIRLELDGPLASAWENNRLTLVQLWDYYAQFPYLTRLRDRKVLEKAITECAGELDWIGTGFALARGFDEKSGKFEGLVLPTEPPFGQLTDSTLIVRPEEAVAQREGEGPIDLIEPPPIDPPPEPGERPKKRFFGSVTLDSEMTAKSFNRVMDEVVQHLRGEGTQVRVVLQIEAANDDGFDPTDIRTVSENAKSLKFDSSGFQE